MRKATRVSHPIYSLLPAEIEGFDALANWTARRLAMFTEQLCLRPVHQRTIQHE